MVVIFGWGSGEAQDLGEIAPVVCPNCHNDVFLHHIKSDKQVSLYFVPLAHYGTDEYLACPICRHGLHVAPEHLREVDQMQASTSLYRRGAVRPPSTAPRSRRSGSGWAWRRRATRWSAPQRRSRQRAPPPPGGAGSARGGRAVAAADVPPAPYDALAGYAKLHADGVLTDEEFAALNVGCWGSRAARALGGRIRRRPQRSPAARDGRAPPGRGHRTRARSARRGPRARPWDAYRPRPRPGKPRARALSVRP